MHVRTCIAISSILRGWWGGTAGDFGAIERTACARRARMRIKLITFRYSAMQGGFDDTALVDFARDKELIACRQHFYLVNEVPYVRCVVIYQNS